MSGKAAPENGFVNLIGRGLKLNTFQERLRYLREKAGYSQVEASRRLGIHSKTLSGYEKAVGKPDVETVAQIARFYGVTIDWLLTGTDSKSDLLNPRLIEAIRELSTEQQEHLLHYLRRESGDAAPNDSRATELEELSRDRTITVGGRETTPEEIDEMITFVKYLRIMRSIK